MLRYDEELRSPSRRTEGAYRSMEHPGMERVLWIGLVLGKARKHGYNQAGKHKTRQDKIGQYWRTNNSIDPSTGIGLLKGCPPDHLFL
jgi:hypothetical protein